MRRYPFPDQQRAHAADGRARNRAEMHYHTAPIAPDALGRWWRPSWCVACAPTDAGVCHDTDCEGLPCSGCAQPVMVLCA